MSVRLASRSDLLSLWGETPRDGVIVLDETELAPDFLVLRTGLAGELMQTAVNLGIRLDVVVPDPSVHGPRSVERVREHRRHAAVRFPATAAEARSSA